MRISNYPTDVLDGSELILGTNVDTTTQKYKTVNFTVDTLKSFIATDADDGLTSIVFEGAAVDDHDGTLTSVAGGSSKTYTLPNATGYVALYTADPSGVSISSTPAELNVLDGIPAGLTATEIGYVDGVTSGIQAQFDAINTRIGVGGTFAAGYVAIVNAAGNLSTTTSGYTPVAGHELDVLAGIASTLTTAELEILDGVTATTAEINYLDITTLGTVQASKAVTADANGDITIPTDKAIITPGNLLIKGSSETLAKFTDDGSCELYHDNVKAVETVGATHLKGIKITGGIKMGSTVTAPSPVDLQSSQAVTMHEEAGVIAFLAPDAGIADGAKSAEITFTNLRIESGNAIVAATCNGAGDGAVIPIIYRTAAGSCRIKLWNQSGGAIADGVQIGVNFAVINVNY